MLSWIRQLAPRRLASAAGAMLLGGSRACLLCSRAVGSSSARVTAKRANRRAPHEGSDRAAHQDGIRADLPRVDAADHHLGRVMSTLSRSLCQRCLESIPWIMDVACVVCGRAIACPDCTRRSDPALIANRAAVRYDSTMKEWLAAYKYSGHERLQRLISLMLDHAYAELAAEVAKADPDADFHPLITSVPLSRQRLLERGFNQAERIASDLADRHGLQYRNMLCRIRHTDRQSHKTRAERLRDLAGAFSLDPSVDELTQGHDWPTYTCILLIDDVYTTGSTLHECAKVLHANLSLPVYSVTWAR